MVIILYNPYNFSKGKKLTRSAGTKHKDSVHKPALVITGTKHAIVSRSKEH